MTTEEFTEDDLRETLRAMMSIRRDDPVTRLRSRHANAVVAIDALRLALLDALGESPHDMKPIRAAEAIVRLFGLEGHRHAGGRSEVLAALSGRHRDAWIPLAEEYLRHSGVDPDHGLPADSAEVLALRRELEISRRRERSFDDALAAATGIYVGEIISTDGDAVIDWIGRVRELLPEGTRFHPDGEISVPEDGGLRP